MKPPFGLTTPQLCAIAGVERHIPLTAFRRNGHWKGVVPRKLPNGRLLWPAVQAYQALGKLPPAGRPSPASLLREAVCSRSPDADPFQAQQATEALFSEQSTGATLDLQVGNLLTDLKLLSELVAAHRRRAGQVMQAEDQLGQDQARRLNHAAEDITREVEKLTSVLNWTSPSDKAPESMFTDGPRQSLGGAK